MTFTDYGKQAVAWSLGSDISNNYIQAVAIGDGSGTVPLSGTNDFILANEVKRTIITGSPDFTESRKVAFQGDFNSVEMSGIALTEFGLFASGPSNVGSIWQKVGFGSIVFDGSNELQVFSVLEVV